MPGNRLVGQPLMREPMVLPQYLYTEQPQKGISFTLDRQWGFQYCHNKILRAQSISLAIRLCKNLNWIWNFEAELEKNAILSRPNGSLVVTSVIGVRRQYFGNVHKLWPTFYPFFARFIENYRDFRQIMIFFQRLDGIIRTWPRSLLVTHTAFASRAKKNRLKFYNDFWIKFPETHVTRCIGRPNCNNSQLFRRLRQFATISGFCRYRYIDVDAPRDAFSSAI